MEPGASSDKRDDTLFQKLKSKILPAEPDEEIKCGKCSYNAGTVSNLMKHICVREMTTVQKLKQFRSAYQGFKGDGHLRFC